MTINNIGVVAMTTYFVRKGVVANGMLQNKSPVSLFYLYRFIAYKLGHVINIAEVLLN